MDVVEVGKSIGLCLTAVEKLVSLALLVGLAIVWPAIRGEETFNVLGLTFNKTTAYPLIGSLYIAITSAIGLLLGKIFFMAVLVDESPESGKILEALTPVALHPWVLNPYSYYGESFAAVAFASTSYGLLIVVWWFCFASLHALGAEQPARLRKTFDYIFLAVGLMAMMTMGATGFMLFEALCSAKAVDTGHVSRLLMGKGVMAFVSIGLGGLIYSVIDGLRKNAQETPSS